MRLAAVQTRCGPEPAENLERAAALVRDAVEDGAELVVLPELFSTLGRSRTMRERAEPLHGPFLRWAADLAADTGCTLVPGSFVERDEDGALHNTTALVTAAGDVAAVYRKVHMFDVDVPDARNRESDVFGPGPGAVVAPAGPEGPLVGLTICYDLRFPELYRIEALLGATVVVVPAAFTAATGPAHWELLVRARAVEDQVVVVAADQWGEGPDGIAKHGHSLIVDAWGTVLAEGPGEGDAVVSAEVDLAGVDAVRRRLPSLANRRPGSYHWPAQPSTE